MKSAEIFFEANSNVVFVRVLGSKNKLATTLPGYLDIFLLLWKLSALDNMSNIWCLDNVLIFRKCLSLLSWS
jgi:hypothetical protein